MKVPQPVKWLIELIFSLFAIALLFNINVYGQLPIKPSRTILIETEVGTEMNVSVSPNGKTVLFDVLGEIHEMSIDGGTATQLTSGIAVHFDPKWLPSGDSFIYKTDSLGKVEYFVRDLLNGSTRPALRNEISLGYDINWEKFKIDQYSFQKASGSLDGHAIGYVKGNRLCIRTLKDTVEHVVKELTEEQAVSIKRQHFSFMPNGDKIIIGYGGKLHMLGIDGKNDTIITFKLTVKMECGPLVYNNFPISENPFEVKYVRNASLSSDGKRLVFSTMNRIYILNLQDRKPHILSPQTSSQYQPSFSPDGKWVAYVSWNDKTGGQVWCVSVYGGKPKQLTKVPGQYQLPVWSPDNKTIAMLKGAPKLGDRDDHGVAELCLINRESRTVRIIDKGIPLWNSLSFSKNGQKLYYQGRSSDGGNGSYPFLLSQDVNGKSSDTLLKTSRSFGDNRLQRTISPDGKFLAYSLNEDIYLIKTSVNKTPIQSSIEPFPALRFAQGVDPKWDASGKNICWTYANHFYRVPIAELEHLIPDTGLITKVIRPEIDVKITLTRKKKIGKGIIALKNVHIVTMKNNEIFSRGTILIKDGRIIDIGKTDNVVIPAHAKIINLQGKTVIPGLIDLHCHMRVPSYIFPNQSWMLLANLAYGITTARDPSLSLDSYGYAELLNSGEMIGPRLFSVGRNINPWADFKINNLFDAQLIVDKRKSFGGIAVKQYVLQERLRRQWLLQACSQFKLNMTNEGAISPQEGYTPILAQIGMMKDGSSGVEHNPDWGDVQEDVLKFYAKSGTYFTPTLQVSSGKEMGKAFFNYKYWRSPDKKLSHFMLSNPTQTQAIPTSNSPETLETIHLNIPADTINPSVLNFAKIDREIFKFHGNIGMGSHGNDEGIGAHNELWALQMGGLSNLEALKIATIMSAKALGVQKDLGSIEVGKIADLVILNKNPLDDIHNSREIRYVMKDGILYDGDTLNTLWPYYKKCPEWRMKGTTAK